MCSNEHWYVCRGINIFIWAREDSGGCGSQTPRPHEPHLKIHFRNNYDLFFLTNQVRNHILINFVALSSDVL